MDLGSLILSLWFLISGTIIVHSKYFSVSDRLYNQLILTNFGRCLLISTQLTSIVHVRLIVDKKAKWKALLVAVSYFGKTVACFRLRDSRVLEYEKLGTF